MNRITQLFFAWLMIMVIMACGPSKPEWRSLFNGRNLDNWDKHIGTPLNGFEELAKTVEVGDLFSVVEVDGEMVIRIAGNVNASLATMESFENYHLQMEFMWGEEVFTKRNSGLLYHSYGDFGVGLGTWMSSHELQLMTGSVGDSYRMGDTYCEIPVVQTDSVTYVYDALGNMTPFGNEGASKIARKAQNAEKPIGQWNTVEIYCVGDTAVQVVNGQVQVVNYKSGKYEGDAVQPLTSGRIQFQSEGGELYIRNVKIMDISAIPAELLP